MGEVGEASPWLQPVFTVLRHPLCGGIPPQRPHRTKVTAESIKGASRRLRASAIKKLICNYPWIENAYTTHPILYRILHEWFIYHTNL